MRYGSRLKFCWFPGFCIGILTFLLCSSTEGKTATYYVDSQAGSDHSDGHSPQHAWQTLDKVNSTNFVAGDVILLKCGSIWDGQLWPKGSGTLAHPIRISKYGNGSLPQIHGGGSVEDAVLLKNQEFWILENLEVTNSGATPAVRRGVHLAVEDYGEAHHLIVRDLIVHDVSGTDNVKHNGGIILTSDGPHKPSRFVDVLIENNRVYHVDRNGISTWSDRWQRSLWFPSLSVVVRGNQLSDIGGDGIMMAVTDGVLIEHNVVGHANQRSSGYNIAIWTWSADNSIIQYNEAYETKGQRDGEGFDSDWNSRNTLIQYNYSHDNDGGFLLICDDGGQRPADSVGNIRTIVRYNISQNDRHRGIAFSGPVRDSLIYNNTFYIGPQQTTDLVLFTDWNGWPSQTQFLNNIFYSAGQSQIGHAVARADDGAHTSAPGFGPSTNTSFAFNLYFGSITKVDDPHALSDDPRLVAPGTGSTGRDSLRGYSLADGSPARASGEPMSQNGGKDFLGKDIAPCAKPDLGAIQSSRCSRP